MMLYRRQGLIPASRRVPVLTLAEQAAHVGSGGFDNLPALGAVDRTAPGPLLEVSGLTVQFGGLVALRSIELSVPAQSVVAVIGPNGSGKSTLFNAVTGLLRPDSGRIRFAGEDIEGGGRMSCSTRGIARTFQNIRLFPNLTVLENVMIGMHARLTTGPVRALLRLPRTRREEEAARERALEILALFGNRLLPRADHVAASLSYANRRRAEIARALASRPKLLLLDEPTAGMNPAETLELAEQIKSLHRHRADDRADRAQARCRRQPGRQSRGARPRREDRRRAARCGAPRRGGDPRLSRPQRGCSREFADARVSCGRYPLRRPACAEIGRLPHRGRRDRLSARRQRVGQIDDDEGDHGDRVADRRRRPLRGPIVKAG